MRHRARLAQLLLAVLFFAGLLGPWPSGRSDEPFRASLEYTVVAGAYQNAIRVAPVTAMLYPRIAVARDPASPFTGTIYLVGLDNLPCASLVVIRSRDRARSLEAPVGPGLWL